MSHNIRYGVYPENVNKRSVQSYWDSVAAHEDYMEGASGLGSDIRWLEFVCADEKSAEEYIKNHDKGWYDCLAVKFKKVDNVKKTKKHEDLERRYKETVTQLRQIEGTVFCKDFKSQYLGCKKCGSKLNKDYMKSNKCPLCGEDMRSDTVLKNIARLKALEKELGKAIREEELKLAEKVGKKCEILWLVKVEYHT